VCNYVRDQNPSMMRLVTYWFIFALVRAVYTTILVLLIFDSVNVVDAVLIDVEQLDHSKFPLFLSQLILGVSTITSSFLYAFLPVLTVHISRAATQKCHINAQSAAVGTWYMTITGILSIMYLTLYLVTFCINDELNYSAIEISLDCMLRTGISLAIGLPPPAKVINLMKMKIIGRMSNHVAPRVPKRVIVNDQEFDQIC
ncbi:28684_t:CDS:2, partial [Racocetra persica]